MGKRKKSKRHDAVSKPQHVTANPQIAHAIAKILAKPAFPINQDRRLHHPDGRPNRPQQKLNGTRLPPHRTKNTKKIPIHRGPAGRPLKTKTVRIQTVPPRIKFALPKKTMVCVKRKVRREVLLALGRGGGRHKKPHRNRWSSISC